MRAYSRYKIAIFLTVLALINVAVSAQEKPDTNAVLTKANHAYYSLKELGVNKFKCTVIPNWKKLLEENPGGLFNDSPPLNLLTQVAFSVSIDKEGAVKVEPVSNDGGTLDVRITRTVAGIQQTLIGFYQTWVSMMIQPPIPISNNNFSLTEAGSNYLYTDGSGGRIVMSNDFLISEMTAQLPNSKIVIWPKFAKTDKGLLLTSLISDINNGEMKVSFNLHYQEIDGVQMPTNGSYIVSASNRKLGIEVAFTKYQITKQ